MKKMEDVKQIESIAFLLRMSAERGDLDDNETIENLAALIQRLAHDLREQIETDKDA